MNLEERVMGLQHSGEDSSSILAEYMPFITASASRATGRRIGPGDDEFSIAMSAFHEALASFNGSRGKFLNFAAVVIRRRCIDNMRSATSRNREIPFSALSVNDVGESEPFEIEDDSQQRSRTVEQEIEALSLELATYGISFGDLADASPRSVKTRQACATAVRALLGDLTALAQMRASGRLPVAQLCIACALPRKILERHRKYIIAAAEILTNDYPYLIEYVSYITGGQSK